MSRRAGATGQSDSTRRHRSVHTPGPMALLWITVARGVMAIVLGLALALHGDRAPAALVNFMGVYWILEIGLGATLILTADRHDSLSTWLASAWALVGGAVLLSDALLMRRRLLAQRDDPAVSSSEVAS
jgi:uncharacterized membrane protein HdeD (DUF308 family)